MNSRINHWWTTRPKRKLITVVDVLRVFLTISEGKIWRGTRSLHLEFEKALEEQGLKGAGTRRDQGGGGGRTYARWLSSLGLWFAEDAAGIVRSTYAGEDLLKGADPVPILTHQLLNFQFPSPFSVATRMDARFRLFPFRFILDALLDERLEGYLTQAELGGLVITRAERASDLSGVVSEIVSFRKRGGNEEEFDDAFERMFGSFSKLKDTANTFFNQLEYTQLIDRIGDHVYLKPGEKYRVNELLRQPATLIGRVDEEEYFQRKFGLGPNRKRDDRRFGEGGTISAQDTEVSKVLLVLWDILASLPIKSIDDDLLNAISSKTGVPESKVEKIVVSLGVQPSYEVFERKYLQLAVGGTAFAKEFERSTEGVFGPTGLGFETRWIGASPNNPDVLVISAESSDDFVGVVDAKAYSEYALIGDHRRRMTHVYVPKYRKFTHGGRELDIRFFSYVAGGFASTISRGIENIARDTGVRGHAISAATLLALLRRHRRRAFTRPQLSDLFTLNREIRASELVE